MDSETLLSSRMISDGIALHAAEVERILRNIFHMYTPLKTDHPEMQTIILGWSLEHPLGIIGNNVFVLLWSADQGGVTIEVCLFVPKLRTPPAALVAARALAWPAWRRPPARSFLCASIQRGVYQKWQSKYQTSMCV